MNKIDKLNSYTTTVGNKVRETITEHFKECMQFTRNVYITSADKKLSSKMKSKMLK